MQPLGITSHDDSASPSLTISKRRREVVNCRRPRQTHLQCDSLGRCGTHFPFGLWRIRYQSGVVATDYAYIYFSLDTIVIIILLVRLGCWLRAPYQDLLGVISASRSSSHVRSRLLIGRVLVSMLDMASSFDYWCNVHNWMHRENRRRLHALLYSQALSPQESKAC
jgi:hypothetical protein